MSTPIKVLCVDDRLDQVRAIGRLLEQAGCTVRICQDGSTALHLATAFQPDVCIIDLAMPGMSGEELARRLRQRPGGEQMRCIAATGLWDIDAQHRTHNVGFEEHLVKPLDPERLIEIVMGTAPTAAN